MCVPARIDVVYFWWNARVGRATGIALIWATRLKTPARRPAGDKIKRLGGRGRRGYGRVLKGRSLPCALSQVSPHRRLRFREEHYSDNPRRVRTPRRSRYTDAIGPTPPRPPPAISPAR